MVWCERPRSSSGRSETFCLMRTVGLYCKIRHCLRFNLEELFRTIDRRIPSPANADTRSNSINRGLHIVEDPALWHSTQYTEGLSQGIVQHLVGLEQLGSHGEGTTVWQLGMRHLQLIVYLPAIIAQSWLQSNWNASPGANTSGTKVPRPLAWASRCRSAFHARTKAATRP